MHLQTDHSIINDVQALHPQSIDQYHWGSYICVAYSSAFRKKLDMHVLGKNFFINVPIKSREKLIAALGYAVIY